MIRRMKARDFVKDRSAGVTVEFVVLMPSFLLLTLFILEIAIAILWVGTAEKAVQLGVRYAVVSNYAASRTYAGAAVTEGTRYAVTTGHVYGQNCSASACVPFETMTCTGGTGGDCRAGACAGDPGGRTCFQVIADRIRNTTYSDPAYRGLMSAIQNSNISISYSYVEMGYAGGPLVPRVTVTVTGVPYPTVMTSLVSRLFAYAAAILKTPVPAGLTTLPPITVTLTGEDQNTEGLIGT
jgi:hypothetical protein